MRVWDSRRPIDDGFVKPIKPYFRPRARSVSPSTSPRFHFEAFRAAVHRISLVAVGLLMLILGRPVLLHAMTFAMTLLCSALLLLVRSSPTSGPRERPLLYSAPLVFAFLLCMGPAVAALSSLAAHLLLAHFDRLPSRRSRLRFQGAQLAWAAIGAYALTLHVPAGQALQPWLVGPGRAPLPAVTGATLAAAGFVGVILLLSAAADVGRWGTLRNRIGTTLSTYSAGVLPLVALAPLGAQYGLIAGLPLLLMVALGVQVGRLSSEAAGLRLRIKTMEEMGQASVADAESIEPNLLIERFLKLSQQMISAERSLAWTLAPEADVLTPAVAVPNAGPFAELTVQPGEGLIGHAASLTRPRLIPDAARDRYRGEHETASGAWLLYPIVVRGRVFATAQWTRSVHQPFTLEDIARLDPLVRQTAIALENVAIRASIKQQAATDGLTGLWNQKHIADLLRDEMARSARYHRALSILIMDVDSFKTFNDTYGHLWGDHLLCRIANVLRSNVRSVDHVGRFGGEEFLVVLPETGKDDGFRLAERLRQTVEEQGGVTLDGEQVFRTISIGVASYPEDALNPADLLQRADDALYHAKRAGKNRVIWA